MIKSTGSFSFLVSLGCSVAAIASQNLGPDVSVIEPTIHVRIYNYAKVSDGTLRSANVDAARVYANLGVKLAWVDCPCSAGEAPDYAACEGLPHGPSVLQVNILDKSMAQEIRAARLDFGISMLSKDGSFAHATAILFNRVEALAKQGIASRSVLLGHIVAHEIGHLLLGRGSHSDEGIMRVPWDKAQLRQAFAGRLLFTAQQGEEIRAQVLKRVRASRQAESTDSP